MKGKIQNSSGQLLDLLYPQNRFDRVNECRQIYLTRNGSLPYILHRITMFLTFKCNLKCFYCNMINLPCFEKKRKISSNTFDFNRFAEFIDNMSKHDVRHLHLTGGEVTVVKDLHEMIKYASSRNIPCSITTNGTAPFNLYEQLVDNGLKEIRISIDTMDEAQFDTSVGKNGAFKKVIHTISGLVDLRDQKNRDIYLILNVCVNRSRFADLPVALEKMIQLGADDIKLIGISHDQTEFKDSKNVYEIVGQIERYLAKAPRPYPLLHKKLKTIFSKDTYGIGDFASKSLMKNCFVPLTERTVDSNYYYPCPVYLREGGQPLGSLIEDDSPTQYRKIKEFVNGDSCLTDPVCKASCIYCTKIYNNHMNVSIHKRIRKISGSYEPITNEIRYEKEIPLNTVIRSMEQIENERSGYDKNVPFHPFFVIKPNGIQYEDKIISLFERENIGISEIRDISDWNRTALKLYTWPATLWNIYRGLLFEQVLPLIEGHSLARIVTLNKYFSADKLNKLKHQIRKTLPPENYVIYHQDEVFVTSPGFLHTPDNDTFWLENNILLK